MGPEGAVPMEDEPSVEGAGPGEKKKKNKNKKNNPTF